MDAEITKVAAPKIIGTLGNAAISMAWLMIPLYATYIGASNMLLGVIGMFYGLMYFVSSYLFGYLSDKYSRKLYIRIGLMLSGFTFLAQVFATDPYILLFVRGLCGFTAGMYIPGLIAYVTDTHRPLGKFTSFLSLGWALGSFLAGVLAIYYRAFIMSSILFFLGFALSLLMPDVKFIRKKLPLFPVNLMKKNAEIYISYFIRHTGAQTVWIIFPLYLSAKGISIFNIGILFTANTLTQFTFMQFSDRFDSRKLIIAGYIGTAITFLIILLSRNFLELLISQFVLGVSWGCLYSGSVRYIAERNIEIGTTTGMLQSSISLSAVIGPPIGGAVAHIYGYSAPLYLALGAAVIALFVFMGIQLLKGQCVISQPKRSSQVITDETEM